MYTWLSEFKNTSGLSGYLALFGWTFSSIPPAHQSNPPKKAKQNRSVFLWASTTNSFCNKQFITVIKTAPFMNLNKGYKIIWYRPTSWDIGLMITLTAEECECKFSPALTHHGPSTTLVRGPGTAIIANPTAPRGKHATHKHDSSCAPAKTKGIKAKAIYTCIYIY